MKERKKHVRRVDLTKKGCSIKKIAKPKKRTASDIAKKSAVNSRYIRNQSQDKTSYLRYLGFVKTYISVKYDISKSDLDILLYLYNEDYFDYEYFYAFVKILEDKKYGQFKRFMLSGYIVKVESSLRYPRAAPKVIDASLYKISNQAKSVIDNLYKHLTKLIDIDANSEYVHLVPEEAQIIINKFQSEIYNITSKRQNPDRIVPPSVKMDGRKKVIKLE
jgi:hypothetical protein